MPLFRAIPAVRGHRGRPRFRPRRLYADRGYDHDRYRRVVRTLGITPVIARRGQVHARAWAFTGGWSSVGCHGCTVSGT